MQPDPTTPPAAPAFDPETASTADIAARLTAGAAGRSAYERAATMLLTQASHGDLLDLPVIRATIQQSGDAWHVRWYELARGKTYIPLSSTGVAVVDLACALAADSHTPNLGFMLARMDHVNRRLAADAFALAAGVYAAPPPPDVAPWTATEIAWWTQRFFSQHGATVMHGDMGMAGEEPTLELTLPDGRGRFLITFEDGADAQATRWAGTAQASEPGA